MSKEPVPRDKHKARMIEIAVGILESEGLSALQARRVAQDCGCSVGTLYNTFDGLDDLIIQANSLTLDRLRNSLLEVIDGTCPEKPAECLMNLALCYLRFAVDNASPWRALFEHRGADHWAPPVWYLEKQSELLEILEVAIARTVSRDIDRKRGARALFSAVHGIVSLALDRKLGTTDLSEVEAQVRFVVAAGANSLHLLNGHAKEA